VNAIQGKARTIDLYAYSKKGQLLERKLGERIQVEVRRALRNLWSENILILNFQHIKFTTSSCLKEIIRIYEELKGREFKDYFVLLKMDLRNEEMIDCLSYVVTDRRMVVPTIDERNHWRLFGKLSKALEDSLQLVREKGFATSSQASAYFHIPLSAASNRLKQLYELKVVQRHEQTIPESGGRQFVYEPLVL
jgi:hypothetical protein